MFIQSKASAVPLMESFYTIQGEGFYTGHAAYFIRLAGCDVGCPWCDVKESWQAELFPTVAVDALADQAAEHPGLIVVITGGEPLMYDLSHLCIKLSYHRKRVHLETSGAYPLTGNWNWICLSPKKFKAPLASVALQANELKVVIFNKSDFLWAEQNALTVKANCKLYLQPEWSKSEAVLPLIIQYVKEHPQWQISIQTHKFMQIL